MTSIQGPVWVPRQCDGVFLRTNSTGDFRYNNDKKIDKTCNAHPPGCSKQNKEKTDTTKLNTYGCSVIPVTTKFIYGEAD